MSDITAAQVAERLILSTEEVQALTGYSPLRPGKQLAELRRQGFHRARRSPTTGAVILERAHVEAVCSARQQPEAGRDRPRLRAVR